MLVARSEMKHPTGKLNDNHNRYQFQAPIEDLNAKVQLQDNAVLAIDHVLQTHGRTLPRIGYIFVGYDMYKGNPLSSAGVDPGFLTIPVYESAYSGRTTADVLSFVPDGVWARQTLSCEKLTKTKIFQSLSSYITELASYVGANINLFNFASAGMNAEINSKVSHLETKHDIIIQTTATCKVYNIALDPVNPPNLGKSFFEAVKSTSFSNASAVRTLLEERVPRSTLKGNSERFIFGTLKGTSKNPMRGYFARYPSIGYFGVPLGYFARYPSIGYFGVPLGYFARYPSIGYFGVPLGYFARYPSIGYFGVPLGYFARYPSIGYFGVPLGYFTRYPSIGYFGVPLGYFMRYPSIGYFGVPLGYFTRYPSLWYFGVPLGYFTRYPSIGYFGVPLGYFTIL